MKVVKKSIHDKIEEMELPDFLMIEEWQEKIKRFYLTADERGFTQTCFLSANMKLPTIDGPTGRKQSVIAGANEGKKDRWR